ncbi:hypothetical protein HNV08_15790 [Winogradskyella eckloniae]|uniref:hypothetical protein n=1 Tax=Winogradskyella eckloniae TaxID=1089306 RepID=UPI0015674337|nr:hypothetical protein [Winogradskyella eckloniae]NRD21517.1 hypothetical protein [Winogradskyella eckloniae]
MKQIKFPIAQFHHKYDTMDFMNYKVLMGDKKFVGEWLADIIDSDGYLYKLKSVKAKGRTRVLDSIKLVGNIVEYEPVLCEPEKPIDLAEFKNKAIDFLKRKNSYYNALDDYKNLINQINSKNDFEAIMKIFVA